VPAPVYTCFDYLSDVPDIDPGTRVRVRFGKREILGVTVGPARAISAEELNRLDRFKPILERLDPEPLLSADALGLCQWTADYYQHPLGEVIATALPAQLRQIRRLPQSEMPWLHITEGGRIALETLPARSRQLRSLLAQLVAEPALRSDIALPAAVFRRAREAGWIEQRAAPDPARPPSPAHAPPGLSEEQSAALEHLAEGRGFGVTLIEGVTGSGKTEIYLRRTADALAAGGQVLVLTPEIGLTPQLIERFRERFGTGVLAYHSALSEGDRGRAWLEGRSGRSGVVIGTRSAVFLPLPKLALVVIDEEHDTSFKQQDGLRYSARDVAIKRAQNAGVPVILGSATPSLETLHNAAQRRYGHLHLRQRINARPSPRLGVVDLRGQRLFHGLSQTLLDASDRHLAAGGQVLMFVNRRGYAPVLLCHACGWSASCTHCDARLTLHRARNRLICHHCGAVQGLPPHCPSCASATLIPVGQGTERLEDALRERYPGLRIERFDSDRAPRKGELEHLLRETREGRVHVLVGTQMLAKGHDFAGLSLVGIVTADQALYSGDFRALERMGQLVTQVAGRAGRGDRPGEVILQTHEPTHVHLQALVDGGYARLSAALLRERRSAGLPPYSHLALLRAEAAGETEPMEFLRAAAKLIDSNAVQVMGPIPAPMERRAGRVRAQLLLQSTRRPALQALLHGLVRKIEGLPKARRVRWSVDVDPVDLF
jgi:primosomal protein N' (replication factor Y)